ncbi:helix-turn-helix transcriptional regulator [Caulobacter sp. 73W]|uniref:Helix-turn-helix transcriptional regulator n=1 Tax=Caulobacter sp. 73W TaxID=3161137 RepID=A0AB39KWY4_9CAUL
MDNSAIGIKGRANAFDRAVGERIRLRRRELQIAQPELGRLLGVSFQQIQKYERGVNRLGASKLRDVALALNTSVASLLNEAEAIATPYSELARLLPQLSADDQQVVLQVVRRLAQT